MVAPGSLNLSVVRGTQFEGLILRCADEKVSVTSPNLAGVVGLYTPSGQFDGYDLFILEGTPSWFLYFNADAASYVIAQTLTTAALTNFLRPSSVLVDPNGNYIGQGTLIGKTATAADNPVDLTGYEAEALVRRSTDPKAEVVLDLSPSVTDAALGEITIPPINSIDTEDLRLGNFNWDLILKFTATDERFGPFAKGVFQIADNYTSTLIPV